MYTKFTELEKLSTNRKKIMKYLRTFTKLNCTNTHCFKSSHINCNNIIVKLFSTKSTNINVLQNDSMKNLLLKIIVASLLHLTT